MQNGSILKQERLKRGWSYAKVEAKTGIPQRSQENAENGYHFPRQRYIELYCNLYNKSAEQLGLVKSGMIGGGKNTVVAKNGIIVGTPEGTPMSDFLKSSLLTDLSSRLNSILGAWPRRNLHYEDLQAEINKAVTDYNRCVEYDVAYAVTRRDACKSVMLIPLQLCGLDQLVQTSLVKIPKDTEGLLSYCAAGIAVCWYMRRGKDLYLAYEVVSWYIPILQGVLSSPSEKYRKAAAGLLAQCFTLKSKLANALHDDDQAIAYEEEAIRYALIAENVTEQAIANREMASLYLRREKYKLALPYAETAYGLAKNAPRIIRSFTASGLANCQASSGHLEDAQISLKEAHDFFDPTMLIPSLPYGEARLSSVDASVYQQIGNFKEAIDIYQQYKTFPTTVLGNIQNNIEYATTEVSRDDISTRDMDLCITLLTEGITGARELDSKWYIREAHECYNLLRIAWPREDAIKKLGKDHLGIR